MRNLIEQMRSSIDKLERELYTEGERKILRELSAMRNRLVRLEDDVMHHYAGDWFRCSGCDQLYFESDRSGVEDCAEYCCTCVPEID